MTVKEAQALVSEVQNKVIANLKENKIEEKESLSFDGILYWKEGDKTPFCPICFENDKKNIHLTYNEGYPGSVEYSTQEPYHNCKVCDKIFY